MATCPETRARRGPGRGERRRTPTTPGNGNNHLFANVQIGLLYYLKEKYAVRRMLCIFLMLIMPISFKSLEIQLNSFGLMYLMFTNTQSNGNTCISFKYRK